MRFTLEQEAQLAAHRHPGSYGRRAAGEGCSRPLLEEDARFRAAVQEGIAQADRGEFIEEEEMNVRFERTLQS